MNDNPRSISHILKNMLRPGVPDAPFPEPAEAETNAGGQALPQYADIDISNIEMISVRQDDGRLSKYPPPDYWEDWIEWDGKAWPKKVARRYTLVPTVCFNCESACGLLAYVDKTSLEIKKFEGNPAHPGSRGRICA